mmetsp:Transcript_7722/g.15412  ORF Transcript_7722/g.15412 Transcript_7722/m.15412 type:complete len:138 (+) Transcript_7722:176-589(+)|eukprot:CAMPEP_0197558402 /NCGR_PEP_ID=MMETSP1320-20131121/19157_1 /TAXON_ID=91990 /ORGANISM="Bolidomonas sp., Strain RCC2347" /LENGTH=137 /DNA_ID=CAMNT_0043119711 /DNA_START=157 /DNA_END=570 /DNA_ORIENTATION=+
MTVRLRLQRLGRKKAPFYRLVSCDSRSKRDGKFLEVLGTYDPIVKQGQKEVRINVERCRYWLGVGAQPSDVVKRLLGQFGVLPPHVHKRQRQSSIPKSQREFSTEAAAARLPQAGPHIHVPTPFLEECLARGRRGDV